MYDEVKTGVTYPTVVLLHTVIEVLFLKEACLSDLFIQQEPCKEGSKNANTD